MNLVFALALFSGTAAIAAWIAARFPTFAPKSLLVRGVSVAVSVALLQVAPIATGGAALLYVTVFGLAIVLLAVWLSAVWMLQSLRDLIT